MTSYFATAPVTSAATFFEDARQRFGSPPGCVQMWGGLGCGYHGRGGDPAAGCGTGALRIDAVNVARARAMRILGLPHPWAAKPPRSARRWPNELEWWKRAAGY